MIFLGEREANLCINLCVGYHINITRDSSYFASKSLQPHSLQSSVLELMNQRDERHLEALEAIEYFNCQFN